MWLKRFAKVKSLLSDKYSIPGESSGYIYGGPYQDVWPDMVSRFDSLVNS